MDWAQTLAGAAVAWLIAAVSILASGANPVFGYVAFGLAAAFTVAAVVAHQRAQRADKARVAREGLDQLPDAIRLRIGPFKDEPKRKG